MENKLCAMCSYRPWSIGVFTPGDRWPQDTLLYLIAYRCMWKPWLVHAQYHPVSIL